MINPWQEQASAPKTGEWILACIDFDMPFTVRYITPFSADPHLADWRDERGKVRSFRYWKVIV